MDQVPLPPEPSRDRVRRGQDRLGANEGTTGIAIVRKIVGGHVHHRLLVEPSILRDGCPRRFAQRGGVWCDCVQNLSLARRFHEFRGFEEDEAA